MKINKARHAIGKRADMKKNFRFIIVAFLIFSVCTTMLSLQEFSTLPWWLKISTSFILISTVGLFIHGFLLLKKFRLENWTKNTRFIFLFLLIYSVQLLLTSNAMYIIGVKEGEINEQVSFLQFTILLYLASAVIFFILSLFISLPKFRRVNSLKAYVVCSLLAVVIIGIGMSILNWVERTVFTNPDTISSAYDFFIGSVMFLFPVTVLGTGLARLHLERIRRESS